MLGVADSAAIRFGGPAGTLVVDALPSGTISGFAAGDMIEMTGGGTAAATGLSYTQTSGSVATLTLTKGGHTVGTLTLAGNYRGQPVPSQPRHAGRRHRSPCKPSAPPRCSPA